jgi:hypothetical protein
VVQHTLLSRKHNTPLTHISNIKITEMREMALKWQRTSQIKDTKENISNVYIQSQQFEYTAQEIIKYI